MRLFGSHAASRPIRGHGSYTFRHGNITRRIRNGQLRGSSFRIGLRRARARARLRIGRRRY